MVFMAIPAFSSVCLIVKCKRETVWFFYVKYDAIDIFPYLEFSGICIEFVFLIIYHSIFRNQETLFWAVVPKLFSMIFEFIY